MSYNIRYKDAYFQNNIQLFCRKIILVSFLGNYGCRPPAVRSLETTHNNKQLEAFPAAYTLLTR